MAGYSTRSGDLESVAFNGQAGAAIVEAVAVHVRFDESGGAFDQARTVELVENEVRQIDDGIVTRRVEVDPGFIARVRAATKAVVDDVSTDELDSTLVIDGTQKRLVFCDEDDTEQIVAWDADHDPAESLWELVDILDEPFETEAAASLPDLPDDDDSERDDPPRSPSTLERAFGIDDLR